VLVAAGVAALALGAGAAGEDVAQRAVLDASAVSDEGGSQRTDEARWVAAAGAVVAALAALLFLRAVVRQARPVPRPGPVTLADEPSGTTLIAPAAIEGALAERLAARPGVADATVRVDPAVQPGVGLTATLELDPGGEPAPLYRWLRDEGAPHLAATLDCPVRVLTDVRWRPPR
jgi:hypothetical protein